jgi:glycolate oxidase iron-sulfur subunit
MAAPPIDLDDLRKCVHCGICLPQCPTYRVLGEEMDSPRGRLYLMRAWVEGRQAATPTFARHMELCLGCRACETACPAGVPFGALLEGTRAGLHDQAVASGRRPLEPLIARLVPRPRAMAALLTGLRAYQRSGIQRLVRASRLLRRWPRLASMEALLPVIPSAPPLPALVPATGPRRGRVGLLTGCVQRALYARVNHDTARLLSLAGYDVAIPAGQGCCGALDLHGGRLESFRTRARALVAQFDAGLDAVVVNAAGCGAAMKDYGRSVPADAAVAAFAGRVRDVSEMLVDAPLPLGPLPLTVTYHDPCHLAHGQRIRTQPRALLQRIPGLRLVPLSDSDLCCGSAGVYNLLEPAMADRLLEMKLERLRQTGARAVATGNPGCLLQIARGVDLEVVHPVELLARSVAARPS